jgi:hypothetical protein
MSIVSNNRLFANFIQFTLTFTHLLRANIEKIIETIQILLQIFFSYPLNCI